MSKTPLTAAERETTVTVTDADRRDPDGVVMIETSIRPHIRALRGNPRVRVVAEGNWGGTPWIRVEVPAKDWSPATGVKRRPRGTGKGRFGAEKASTAAILDEPEGVTGQESLPDREAV